MRSDLTLGGGAHTVATTLALTSLLLGMMPSVKAARNSAEARPFAVEVSSQALFDVQPPWENEELQRTIVEAHDGTDLFIETWLPKAKPGAIAVPEQMPTIVMMTPYARKGWIHRTGQLVIEWLVPRGYAFSVMHIRGSGESGGCIDFTGTAEVLDGERVLQYLGDAAPWSDGNVGAIGNSYPGGTALATAADGHASKTRHLKAMVILAPSVSMYQTWHYDGVRVYLQDEGNADYFFQNGFFHGADPSSIAVDDGVVDPHHAPERLCASEIYVDASDNSGDFNGFWREREHRFNADRIKAATLMVHGHLDGAVLPAVQTGLFNRISAPKAGIFGVFDHDWPADPITTEVHPEWKRTDFWPMVVNWFDRWLKGIHNGADKWPIAQVQGTDGRWRAENGWPETGGRTGCLVLSEDGALGVATPSGSSTYAEGLPFADSSPVQEGNDRVVFETPLLTERLEVTGRPYLDLWVTLSKPDAHIAASLEVIDPEGSRRITDVTIGARSMRHLEPFENGIFVQEHGARAPVGTPFKTVVRFNPTDIVVPPGSRLRLTITDTRRGGDGVPILFDRPTEMSGSFTAVTVHHDVRHPSVLRFEMPDKNPDLLDVLEVDEDPKALGEESPSGALTSDGGGIANGSFCTNTR